MRILIVSPYFPPQPAVAALRVHAFARDWAAAGHQVTVLTTTKRADQRGMERPGDGFELVELDYRVPRVLERLRAEHKSANGDSANVSAKSSDDGRGRRLSRWRRVRERTGIFASVRMPDLTGWWIRPAVRWARQRAARDGSFDVVVSSSGPYTAHLVARALRRREDARTWAADFRDLWTDNHHFSGLFPFTLREWWLERDCLARADLIVTVSEGLARTLRAKTIRPVRLVPNGFDPDDFTTLSAAPAFTDDGIRRLVYTGTLYVNQQDPMPLLRTMRTLRQEQPEFAARFRLVVAGADTAPWRERAAEVGVNDLMEDRRLLPRAEALRLQRDAQALLLIDWPDSDQGVLTGKLFEYLHASAPILLMNAQPQSPLAEYIREAGRGHIVPSGDDDQLRARLLQLVLNPASLATESNPAFLKTTRRAHQSARFLTMLRELTR